MGSEGLCGTVCGVSESVYRVWSGFGGVSVCVCVTVWSGFGGVRVCVGQFG